jgi:hypothetical protein
VGHAGHRVSVKIWVSKKKKKKKKMFFEKKKKKKKFKKKKKKLRHSGPVACPWGLSLPPTREPRVEPRVGSHPFLGSRA